MKNALLTVFPPGSPGFYWSFSPLWDLPSKDQDYDEDGDDVDGVYDDL